MLLISDKIISNQMHGSLDQETSCKEASIVFRGSDMFHSSLETFENVPLKSIVIASYSKKSY